MLYCRCPSTFFSTGLHGRAPGDVITALNMAVITADHAGTWRLQLDEAVDCSIATEPSRGVDGDPREDFGGTRYLAC